VRRSSWRKTALIYTTFMVAAFLVGPPLLLALAGLYRFEWQSLSDIGQSYTGLSALLSAGALAAVAVSMRLQAREDGRGHAIAMYNAQKDLIDRALDEPAFLSCVGLHDLPEGTLSQMAYNTLWLRYYELGYMTGNLDSSRVLYSLKSERFSIPLVRNHWYAVRKNWLENGPRDFVELVDKAYQAALLERPPADFPRNAKEGQENMRASGDAPTVE
jgi:hypothetical protein